MTDPELAGVLVVDKPKGPTSHDIVASLRRVLQMRRIGHCGTLDPLASGVLVVCLGRFTRLNRWLSGVDKVYEAVIRLGATSATGDAQGPIEDQGDVAVPSQAEVAAELASFIRVMDQVPPAYSAVKVAGVPSYKRARRGEDVELKARRVEIFSLAAQRYDFPDLAVRIHCSSGTYVRTLAEDIGRALGTGAYLADLRRTQVGQLGIDKALSVENVAELNQVGRLDEAFVHPGQALSEMAAIELSAEELVDFAHGKSIDHQGTGANQADECAVFDAGNTLFGIARWENGALRPSCVLRQPSPSG